MKHFFGLLIQQMEQTLVDKKQGLSLIDQTAEAIRVIQHAIGELRVFLSQYEFDSVWEEIDFFKHQAPDLFSSFIYYKKLHHLYTQNAAANRSLQKKLLQQQYKKMGYFYCANVELLSYYATGLQDRDDSLFTRKHRDILFTNEDYAFMIDTSICPLATYKIAKMNAYQKLEPDILIMLRALKKHVPDGAVMKQNPLTWTASKIAAAELLYSLFASSVINNGQARLKELVNQFEQLFNIELKDYQNYYQDMKMRKKVGLVFCKNLELSWRIKWMKKNECRI